MKRTYILFLTFITVVALGPDAWSQQSIVLSTPTPSATSYSIQEVTFQFDTMNPETKTANECAISVLLVPNVAGPQDIQHMWRGATVCTRVKALNKKMGLQDVIMDQLLLDKVLVGAKAGTAE
jgi:hypothetical protein